MGEEEEQIVTGPVGLVISEAVRLGGGTIPTARGVLLSAGVKNGVDGKRVFTPDFIRRTASGWVGRPIVLTDTKHGKASAVATIGEVVGCRVENGRQVFDAEFLADSQVARDALAVARRFGAAVSIDGTGVARRTKDGLEMQADGWQPHFLAWLMPGEQADAEAIAHVAMARGELEFIETREIEGMADNKELEAKVGELAKAEEQTKVALAAANDELTAVKAQRDGLLKEKADAERGTVLAAVVALAKELEEPEPTANASVEDLKVSLAQLAKAKEVAERVKVKLAKPTGAKPVEQPASGGDKPTAADRLRNAGIFES